MKLRALLVPAFLLPAAAAAQTSPAQMGVTPTATPEVLQVLDKNGAWVPIGSFPPGGPFAPIGGGGGGGGEVDILPTDPSIGMAAGGADNSPFVGALMNKMGPAYSSASLLGYDVTFPSIPGQQYTAYYFSQPLDLSRGGRYHCSGSAGASSGGYAQTALVFAPGVDGVIQDNATWSPDGGIGAGSLEDCGIYSLGMGEVNASGLTAGTPAANTQLTGSFNFSWAGIHGPGWAAGDGIIVTPLLGRYHPYPAIPSVAPGAYVSNVSGTTLTLAAPYVINPAFGAATASFKQTGQANFANGDTLIIGNNTYNAVTTLGAAPGNFLIGSDWYVSASHLAAAINGGSCTAICVAPGATPNVGMIPPISALLGFWSKVPGTAGNALPTGGTTAAGAWQGSTPALFSGGLDSNTAITIQLPASQKFMVQTTTGSNTVTAISGPRFVRPGDIVWSDAFPFGTSVGNATPANAFPQTVTMIGPFQNGTVVNATVTHAPGAEGQWWVTPAGLKRRITAQSRNNAFQYWGIGLEMSCSNGWGSSNCTISHDYGNTGYFNLFGRWVAGNNTSGTLSLGESFGKNFIADVVEGGTLGGIYVNLHSESPENGEGPYNVLGNCFNQNNTTFFGGYAGGVGAPDCVANQANMLALPPTAGKFLRIGANNTLPIGAPAIGGAGWLGSMQVQSGMNSQDCVLLGRGSGGASPYGGASVLALSTAGCGAGSILQWNWNPTANIWEWGFLPNTPIMKLFGTTAYTGYEGPGFGAVLPFGVIMGGDGNNNYAVNGRLFGMANSKPAGNWHLRGDTEINTVQSPGGQMAWYYAPQFSTTLTAAVVKGTTTSVTVAACPAVAPPAGTLISDVSVSLSPNVNLGIYSSCSAGTLTFTSAAINSSFGTTDAIQFLYPYGAGPVSNDPVNPDYTATTVRTGSSANKDLGGRITLAAGTAAYTLAGVYATAPVCFTADATTPANASSVSETTTVLTFTGTGTDVIKYHCLGRN